MKTFAPDYFDYFKYSYVVNDPHEKYLGLRALELHDAKTKADELFKDYLMELYNNCNYDDFLKVFDDGQKYSSLFTVEDNGCYVFDDDNLQTAFEDSLYKVAAGTAKSIDELKKSITIFEYLIDHTKYYRAEQKYLINVWEYVNAYISEKGIDEEADKYINILIENDYPGAKELKDKYYTWEFDVVLNGGKDSISVNDEIEIKYRVKQGPPNERIDCIVRYEIDNQIAKYYEIAAYKETWGNDGFEIRAPGKGMICPGIFKVYIYDKDNNLLGYDDIKIDGCK